MNLRLIAASLFVLAAATAGAETIHLKNKKTIVGEIVQRDASQIKVKTETGLIPVPLARVAPDEPGSIQKAEEALAGGKPEDALRLAEIALFWDSKHKRAAELRESARKAIEQATAGKEIAALEKEAEAAYAKSAAKVAALERHGSDINKLNASLKALEAELRGAAKGYAQTSKGEAFAKLLAAVESSSHEAAKAVGAERQERREQAEIASRVTMMRAAEAAKGGGSASGEKIKTVGRNGASVDLREHAVREGITLFDFYADWCGPCKQLAPQLEKFARDTPGVYLRKIDIRDWKSPVAKRYQLNSIPSVWVFKNGSLAAERLGGMGQIQAAVAKAK